MGLQSFDVDRFGLDLFKVKQWSTGFGKLSFQWIQICIGSLMHKSSC